MDREEAMDAGRRRRRGEGGAGASRARGTATGRDGPPAGLVVGLGLGVGLAAGLASPTSALAQATIGGEWREDVDAFARRVVEAELTPGMAVAVAVDDWVTWTAGFGTADMDAGRAVTPHTPFYIASTTKSLTATAAVLAAARGELELEAPMVRYLPDARLPEGVDGERITVRDLLALTHGLSGGGPVVLRTAYTGEFTRDRLLELLRHHAPTGEHGTFDYNNLGYNLLGLVLESALGEADPSGQRWKEVVRREVLDPIGMADTRAYVSAYDPDRLALPHDVTPEGFARIPLAKADANLHAAGGHFATAGDLARYLAVHQSGGFLEGERVLPGEPLALTHELHTTQDRDFGPYHRHGWGYGWDLGTYGADTLIHRFGGFAGYRSHMSFMPAHGVGVVVLVNGGGPASAASDLVATYIYDRLLGKADLETRYAARLDSLAERGAERRAGLADHLRERAARMAPLSHPLEDYAGTYENPLLGRMVWRVVAGGLEMRQGVVESRAEVYDAASDQLRVEVAGSGTVAEFAFPEDGGPARSLTLLGIDLEFRRVGPPEPGG